MGQYVINEEGAMVWEADPPPEDVVIEHPLGETPAGHEHEEAEPKRTGADGGAWPSRTALMSMPKDELEAFASEHGVDPTGATKQQIVDTLYSED